MNSKLININTEILRKSGWFITVISFFFIMFFVMQNINNRFWLHDCEVYYSATNSFLNGGQVYGVTYGLGSGFYKYSPFALLIFTPFAMLPFAAAKIVHFILLSFFIIATIILSVKHSSKYFIGVSEKQRNNLLLFLVFLPLLPNVYTELHLGNINVILLFIFLIALQSLLSGKEIRSGVLIAIGILIKPHFIVFIPLLLMRKKYRTIATIFAGLAAGILLPALFIGVADNILLHKDWMATMQIHNNSLISGQDTVYSWIYRAIVQYIYPSVTGHDKMFGILILAIIASLFLVLILFHFKKEKVSSSSTGLKQSNFLFEFIVLLAVVPNITVTDSEHFLLSIPLIALVITSFFKIKKYMLLKAIGVLSLILYGMNIRDVVGNTCSAWLTANGILGLANFMIIGYSIYIYTRHGPTKSLEKESLLNL